MEVLPLFVLFVLWIRVRAPPPTHYPYTTTEYPCDCSHSEKPHRNSRIWIFKLAQGRKNNPPEGYKGVIIRVTKSEKGKRPYMNHARINAKIDECGNPLEGLRPECTYRVHVYGKNIRHRNHFIVDRCNPPEEIECPKLSGCYK